MSTAPSYDFPPPTSNPRSFHPRWPHNSWSHVLRWPKSFNMEQRPESARTPSSLSRSSQASLHQFLYRSVLYFIPLHFFCLYLDISSSVFPLFQRCLQTSPPWPSPPSPDSPGHTQTPSMPLSFSVGSWATSIFPFRASSPHWPCPPSHHCICSTCYSIHDKADAQSMFTDRTLSENLLEVSLAPSLMRPGGVLLWQQHLCFSAYPHTPPKERSSHFSNWEKSWVCSSRAMSLLFFYWAGS